MAMDVSKEVLKKRLDNLWLVLGSVFVLILVISVIMGLLSGSASQPLAVKNLGGTNSTLQDVACTSDGQQVTATGTTQTNFPVLGANVDLRVEDSAGNTIGSGSVSPTNATTGVPWNWSVSAHISGKPQTCLVGMDGVPLQAIADQ
jgi:hypothetical protein